MIARIPRASYRSRPWRNGLGSSDDIMVLGDANAPDYAISETTISADGPFSDYTGYDRTIVLLAGGGFELTFADGEIVRIDEGRPVFSFEGERRTQCRLIDGPVRAFNTISARASFSHAVTRSERIDESLIAATNEDIFVHGPAETVHFSAGASAEPEAFGSGPFEIVRIRSRGGQPS